MSFRASTGWEIEEPALQQILPHATAMELREDMETGVDAAHCALVEQGEPHWRCSFLSSRCAADFMDKWCCSRRPLKETLLEIRSASDSAQLHLVFESNVSACSKDTEMLLSGMHNGISSWNVASCSETDKCLTTQMPDVGRSKKRRGHGV